MLYYNNRNGRLAGIFMTHHHHGGGTPPVLAPSLLRFAVSKRLWLAGWLIALMWTATLWATR
jgi:hypothetical protein